MHFVAGYLCDSHGAGAAVCQYADGTKPIVVYKIKERDKRKAGQNIEKIKNKKNIKKNGQVPDSPKGCSGICPFLNYRFNFNLFKK